jgi:two-component sensor histidine kinase
LQEQERLAAVHRYKILDTPPDGAFDRITRFAARLLKMPISLISFIDNNRIWFKSRHGIAIEEMGREDGLCATCIQANKPLVVTNAKEDPRACANTLVAGEVGAQFYLGAPLRTHDGFNLGTLCVLDVVPRTVSDLEVSSLGDLAEMVMDELEFRLAANTAELAYKQELVRADLREDHISGLTRELTHRSKNLLTVVHAIARQTRSNTHSVKDYVQRLAGRILGLAETHELISEKDWHGVSVADLVWRHLDPFLQPTARVQIGGPAVTLTPIAAQNIGLALHELATNAVRFGALSVPEGLVVLSWERRAELSDRLLISWREQDCPKSDKLHRGFGRLVLEQIVPEALGGNAHLSFDTGCLTWVLDVPADVVISPSEGMVEPPRIV